jgi:hypothetical protein
MAFNSLSLYGLVVSMLVVAFSFLQARHVRVGILQFIDDS